MLRKGFSVETIRGVFDFVDWVMSLPQNEEALFLEEVRQIEEENKMPFMNCIEKVGYDKGIKKMRESVLEILKKRFGEIPNNVTDKVNSTFDETVIQSLLIGAATAKSISAFSAQISD